jgi:hypothetical protein
VIQPSRIGSPVWTPVAERLLVFETCSLAALHLGVIAAERLDVPRAVKYLAQSVQLRPTAIAHRSLAALGTDVAEQWAHYMTAWDLATSDSDSDPKVVGKLQHQLAGEIALFATTVSALADANVTYNNATVEALWPALDTFLATAVPAAPGCSARGIHCDHDMVAFGYMFLNVAKCQGRVSGAIDGGCKAARGVLASWPLGTDDGESYVFSRRPYLQPHFAPRPGDNDQSLWSVCVIGEAEAKAGRPLTPAEKASAVAANPPPYWLGAPLS